MPVDSRREDAPRAGDIRRSLGDPALADRRLDWRPEIGLQEGLARLVAEETV
jgi:nucleoside-diphosphate-sugar epimerase